MSSEGKMRTSRVISSLQKWFFNSFVNERALKISFLEEDVARLQSLQEKNQLPHLRAVIEQALQLYEFVSAKAVDHTVLLNVVDPKTREVVESIEIFLIES